MTHFLPTTRRKCADFTFQTFIFFFLLFTLFLDFPSLYFSHDACDPFNDHCHK